MQPQICPVTHLNMLTRLFEILMSCFTDRQLHSQEKFRLFFNRLTFQAASAGHTDIVRLLIAHGADVNAQSRYV